MAPLLRELGCDPDAVGRSFGIDLVTLSPEARLPYAVVVGLLDAAARETNCPDFGLLLGSRAQASAHGLLFELLKHAPTLRQALIDQITWQLGYSSGAIMYLTRFGQDFALGYGIYDRASYGCAQMYDLVAALFCNYIGVLTGGRVTPVEVLLCHREPEHRRAYQRLLKAPVRFNQNQCCVVLTRQALDTPIPGADPAVRAAILREAEALQGPAYHDFVTRLRRIVRPLLLDETPSMIDAARALGLPVRTMRRRLADDGLTFEEVRDVAQALAFSTHSAFTTAFRRWSGHTPTEWRLHAGAQDAGQPATGQFSVLDKPRPPRPAGASGVHTPMAGE
jgi:AraC-like DNA-binding protein